MLIKTVLNQLENLKGFVFGKILLVNLVQKGSMVEEAV